MRQNVVSLAAPIAFALRAQICRKKSVNFWIFLIKFPVERMGPLSARLYSKALSLLLFRHTATSERETAGSHHKSLHRANRVYSVSEDIAPIHHGQKSYPPPGSWSFSPASAFGCTNSSGSANRPMHPLGCPTWWWFQQNPQIQLFRTIFESCWQAALTMIGYFY